MFRNNLKTAFRNIARNKIHSAISILGLALGISVFAFCVQYVRNEYSFDTFNKDYKNIYRLINYSPKHGEGYAGVSGAIAEPLKNSISEFKSVCRVIKGPESLISSGNRAFYEKNILFADSSFFDIFSYEFLFGSAENILNNPHSIIITENAALKYFGARNALGRIINIGNKFSFTVGGILKNVPSNSHLAFDFLAPMSSAEIIFRKNISGAPNEWGSVYIYVKTIDNFNPKEVEKKITRALYDCIGESFIKAFDIEIAMQKITDIHFTNLPGDLSEYKNPLSVKILLLSGLLILLLAAFNFINLATAGYLERGKEVGVKKVLGANRFELIKQFLTEALVNSLLAAIPAYLFIYMLSIAWEDITQKDFLNNFGLLLIIVGTALITGFISGIYPALFLSSFNPVQAFRNKVKLNLLPFGFRKILITFQFVVSVFLVLGTLVVNSQMRYLRGKDTGFNKDNILVMRFRSAKILPYIESFKNEIKTVPGVNCASASSVYPGAVKYFSSFFWEGQKDANDNTIDYISADHDFLKTYNIKIKIGRDFDYNIASDSTQSYIINQAALNKFGWKDISEKWFEGFNPAKGKVIGVIPDINHRNLYAKTSPLVIFNFPRNFEYLSVNFLKSNFTGVNNRIKILWDKFFPEYPYEPFLLGDELNKDYAKDDRVEELAGFFSFVSILLTLLGLTGLTLLSAKRRTKEIGIRKVIGATSFNITALFIKEYLWIIIIANIIALPAGYYFANKWLQNFVFRVEISAWVFAAAAVFSLAASWAVLCAIVFRASRANPAESLRYE
jgi:putative ABC transport system permease protein